MKSQKHQYWKLAIKALFIISGIIANQSAFAQLIPDNTLGKENSIVNQIDSLKNRIEGGATRGSNLFHSFQEFNVDTGKSVYFANPVNIQNILTRVTGGNISNILGTLGVEGTANLFLINPQGIYFGNGASLDIRGSFTATTADSIKLGENGLFSASNPESSNLLSVQPGALFINALKNQQAQIKNEENLQVGQNLTFNAENINILGNLKSGINLNLQANYTIVIDGSKINSDNDGTGQGGDINIFAGSLYMTSGSYLSANTFGQGDAGTVKITATDSIKFDGGSNATSQVGTGAVGKAGGLDISTKTLEMLGGSYLSANTFGQGDAGTVKITATDSIKFDGGSNATSQVGIGAVGKAGGFDISTKTLEMLGGSYLSASTFGQGDAGTVKITTKTLEMLGGSYLSASTFGQGDAGTVKITATDSIKFDGGSIATSQVGTGAVGKAGGFDISTKTLEMLGGSYLSANTFGQGDAGTVKITATDSIKFDGGSNATSQVGTGAVGKAGGFDISTKTLEMLGGSYLSASTFGQGDAGTVKITATDSIKFDGGSNATSQVGTGAVGKAGGLDISTKTLELLGGSYLSASTFGQGDAGTVKITATDSIKFDGGSNATSQVGTGAVGKAGGFDISTKTLEMLGGSYLSANTFGQGDAGTVKITATDSIKFDGGSNATSQVGTGAVGKAGGFDISTKTLEMLGGSYLSANTFGQGDAGTVNITATDSIKFDGGSNATSQVGTGAVGKAGGFDISTKTLEMLGGSYLSASTFGQGDAGTVKITATDSIKFDGGSNATSQVGTGAVGKAGGFDISTKTLELLGGSYLSANTFGQGDAGTVKITATDSIKFDGGSNATSQVGTGAVGKAGGFDISTKTLELLGGSYLSASTFGQGDAGTVKITANTFTATTGGQVLTTTSGIGKAGNITVNVKDNITLDGTNTGLFANTEKGSTGDSGNITIDPQTFMIKNGAGIGVNSQGSGQGGNISIEAGTLTLDNNAVINAATASSQGGEITLQIQDLLFMNHNSNITATAGTDQAGGNGGNINIYAPFIVAVPYENNDITANAYQGNGGNIKINTNQIFGLQYRPQLTNESDITASSQFGVSGDVVITTPGVDPTSGLINLPTSLVNIEGLNKDVCAIKDGKVAGGSSFIITGKGGLPADTEESITNSPALVEWENNSDVVAQANISPVKVSQKATNYHPQIQQVQGWIITPDGKVILTADSQKITLQTDKNNLPDCK